MKILKKMSCLLAALLLSCLPLTGCQNKDHHDFQGYVESELLYMASPYSGDLDSLDVHRGEKISKNQKLFALDPEPEISQLKSAKERLSEARANLENLVKGQRQTILESLQAQIDKTKAELALASIRVKRYQELYKKNATEKDTLDAVIADYQAKEALLKQSEADLAEAKLGSRKDLVTAQEAAVAAAVAQVQQSQWALDQKTLFSPNNAIVFDTFYWQGEWVAAGQPVLSLLAPQYIRIIFFVPEPRLSEIHLGETITVSCDGCNKTRTATISYISHSVEYTPPVIYSRENNYNLVYRVRATPKIEDAWIFHPGQPVYINLTQGNTVEK